MSEKIAKVGVVVLAAGKGTRLDCIDKPKVMLEIGGKPVVSYIVETLQAAGFDQEQTVLVVGFHQEKIREYFGNSVIYVEQAEQLGTAHAAYLGTRVLPADVEDILVLGGDDSAFYTKEILLEFIEKHRENNNTLSLLTAQPDNYEQLGRVIRNEQGEFVQVLEKEELDKEQRKIKEVSTGTYLLQRAWFSRSFPQMREVPGLGELGLNKAVELAKQEGEKIQAVKLKNNQEWFGINTKKELQQANKMKIK